MIFVVFLALCMINDCMHPSILPALAPGQTLYDLVDEMEKKELFYEANDLLKQSWRSQTSDIFLAYKYAISCIGIGQIDISLSIFNALLDQLPNNCQILYNKGYTLKLCGRVEEAIECYKKVLSLDPQFDSASFALGHSYLFKGDFQEGWKQHELYLKRSNKNSERLRTFISQDNLKNKIILLRYDGGLGDTLQFIRYAQCLKNKGATVLACVQKPLVPLLSRCDYIDSICCSDDQLPLSHDWAALMSLPAIFNSHEDTIPITIPYIYPDESLVAQWKDYLSATSGLKIGICWQASVVNDSSRPLVARRGIPLKEFDTLNHFDQLHFYSLQQHDGLEQLNTYNHSLPIHVFPDTFDEEHGAFMDTAAVVKNMDLIITVDTAIAHLAGALGTPVWLLLPYATDWRWIVHRTDTPWYPSMKIFKQPNPFDWQSVMTMVSQELTYFIKLHTGALS